MTRIKSETDTVAHFPFDKAIVLGFRERTVGLLFGSSEQPCKKIVLVIIPGLVVEW